jgi:hypothetical protein
MILESTQYPIDIRHVYRAHAYCIQGHSTRGYDAAMLGAAGTTAGYSLGGETALDRLGGKTARYSLGGETARYSLGGETARYSLGGETARYSLGGETARYSLGGETALNNPNQTQTEPRNIMRHQTLPDRLTLAGARAFTPPCYPRPRSESRSGSIATSKHANTSSPQPLAGVTKHTTSAQRELLVEYLEALFSQLRGEALLIATLAYGLQSHVSQLRMIRIRDVDTIDTCIVLAGHEQSVPAAIFEDLKEHLHEKICGSEATTSICRRDDLLFSDEAFEQLARVTERVDSLYRTRLRSALIETRFDSRLRILGWLHCRSAVRKGRRCTSPLELFDKGPRIVRRGRAGSIDAYYVWRAASRYLV